MGRRCNLAAVARVTRAGEDELNWRVVGVYLYLAKYSIEKYNPIQLLSTDQLDYSSIWPIL